MFNSKKILTYLLWADESILEIISDLDKEEFTQKLDSYNRSIHDICVHQASDHQWWFHYVTGIELDEKVDFETISQSELIKMIRKYNFKWKELVEKRPFENFEMKSRDKIIPLSFDEIIFHITNHATYHRGQLALALRILGKEVKFTDYVPFLRTIS